MTSVAGQFLQRAAADAFSEIARQRDGDIRQDACVAVAVRDDLRPVDQPFVDELVLGLEPVLTAADCRVVRLYGNDDGLLWTLADYIRKWRLAGMVLVSVHAGDPLPGLLGASGFPIVSVGRTELPNIPFVDADNVSAARTGVAHLVSRRRRRVALVNGDVGQLAMFDRLIGYREGLEEAGLGYDESLVVEADGTRDGAARRFERLLATKPDLDAVLISSGVMAGGVLDVLDRAGMGVPGDVAVVTFDDVEVARERGLTALAQPITELGEAAARLVLDRIAARPAAEEPFPAPTRLVVRASS